MFEEKLIELVSSHTKKINRELSTPFYKSISFWTSIFSALIAIASAWYVYFDYTQGSTKKYNDAVAIQQGNELELKNIDIQRKLYAAEINFRDQDKKLDKKIQEIGSIESLESQLNSAKEKVQNLESLLKANDDKDDRILPLQNKISKLEADLLEKENELNSRPVADGVIETTEIELKRDQTETVLGDFKITLMRVGNYKHNADFYYSHSSSAIRFKVLNLDKGDSIAREFDSSLLVVKVVSTENNPDIARLKISKVKL